MLKKDLIKLCLLHLLSKEDLYGYEMLRRIHLSFPDTQESAIYALMRELCKAGCTKQYAGETSNGPARKYYRITPDGREQLEELLEQWRRLRDTLKAMGIV